MRGSLFGRRLQICILGLSAILTMPISSADASEHLSRAELKERKRYCKILERQLKADVKVGGSGNAGVIGLGGKFELDYPNDLKDQYLAAHTDHVMACGQWRRGIISSDEYRQVRERWIAVYMAGTNQDDEPKNRAALEEIIGSVAKFGFTDERKADLNREFDAMRKEIRDGEIKTGNRSEAVLKAISDAEFRASADNKSVFARLDTIESLINGWSPKPKAPDAPLDNCKSDFVIGFEPGSFHVGIASPIIAQAASCGRGSRVTVIGYADAASGSERTNTQLSAMRAAAVAQALTGLGTSVSQLSFVGSTTMFGPDSKANRVVTIRVDLPLAPAP